MATIYPFDPEGALASNLVQGEQHVLTAANGRDFRCIVPKLGPFHRKDLQVAFKATNGQITDLAEGQDYYLTHKFLSASFQTAKEIFGSITMLRDDLVGTIIFKQRRVLGGQWQLSDTEWRAVVGNIYNNPRTISWEQVAQVPEQFPVINHQFNVRDMVGLQEVVDATIAIRDAILAGHGGSSAISTHVNRRDNPHQVTKTHVGLSLVQNFAIATLDDIQAGAANKYVNPAGLKQYLNDILANVLTTYQRSITEQIAAINLLLRGNQTTIGSAINDLRTSLRAEFAAADTAILNAAKRYTDGKITDLNNSLASIVSGLVAPIYATKSEVSSVVTSLTSLIDNKATAAKNDAITHSNNQDVVTLNSAKAYTDTKSSQASSAAITDILNRFKDSTNSSTSGMGVLSKSPGNLISLHPDGLYYGIAAPPDKRNLYVNADVGNDNWPSTVTNPGSRQYPFRTIKKALQYRQQGSGTNIYLYQGQNHHLSPTNREEVESMKITSSSRVYFHAYGPFYDTYVNPKPWTVPLWNESWVNGSYTPSHRNGPSIYIQPGYLNGTANQPASYIEFAIFYLESSWLVFYGITIKINYDRVWPLLDQRIVYTQSNGYPVIGHSYIIDQYASANSSVLLFNCAFEFHCTMPEQYRQKALASGATGYYAQKLREFTEYSGLMTNMYNTPMSMVVSNQRIWQNFSTVVFDTPGYDISTNFRFISAIDQFDSNVTFTLHYRDLNGNLYTAGTVEAASAFDKGHLQGMHFSGGRIVNLKTNIDLANPPNFFGKSNPLIEASTFVRDVRVTNNVIQVRKGDSRMKNGDVWVTVAYV